MSCHLVAVLHAFRCPIGHGSYAFIRMVVVRGAISLRVFGLVG